MKLVFAALVWALMILPVQAQQQYSITLSCNGTQQYMTAPDNAKPEPIKDVGMTINLSERTVSFSGFLLPIYKADSTEVSFRGQQTPSYGGTKYSSVSIEGTIDRITGAASVMFLYEQVDRNYTWEILCRPVTRLF